jgi:hypothetical protein
MHATSDPSIQADRVMPTSSHCAEPDAPAAAHQAGPDACVLEEHRRRKRAPRQDPFAEDPAAVVDNPRYTRPALHRKPIKPFAAHKEDMRGAIASYLEMESSIVVISHSDHSDTVKANSHDVSEHGSSDETRHGLAACDWSLHGLDSQREARPKTTDELQTELMALVEDALRYGTVTFTDHSCDLASLSSRQSQEAGGPKPGLRESIWRNLTFSSGRFLKHAWNCGPWGKLSRACTALV